MTTSETQNKTIASRYLQAHAANDQDTLNELVASDVAAYHANSPSNREQLFQSIGMFSAATSDRHFSIEDQVAEGDKVMTRCTWQGTHTGNFMGQPPTGQQIKVSAFFAHRIQAGKIVELWSLFDQLSMMQQLGLVPPPQYAGR